MPRQSRVSVGDTIYHVINRANGRVQMFEPFGGEDWVKKTIDRFGLAHTLRGPGRPRQT